MGHRHSITKQAADTFRAMKAFGDSKHDDKARNNNKPDQGKIYSMDTMDNYISTGVRFAKWAREEHGCRDLPDAREHVAEYLQQRIDSGKSAWTLAHDASVLSKLYQVENIAAADGVQLPKRNRGNITQHRNEETWRGHFSEAKNADLVALSKGCGLRRHEITLGHCELDARGKYQGVNKPLLPSDIERNLQTGRLELRAVCGKGGKVREHVPILPRYEEAILDICRRAEAEDRPLIEHIPKYAPCHTYRAEYSKELHKSIARDVDTLPHTKEDRYVCRRELEGIVYDGKAMDIVSEALGHARRGVVTNYIGH